jgi:hypothetical protein
MTTRQQQALRPLRRWVIVVCGLLAVVLTAAVLVWLLAEAGSDPGRRI